MPIPERWHNYATYRSTIWSPLPEIEFARQGLSRSQIIQTDPVCLLALCAAKEAVHNAGLSVSVSDRRPNRYSFDSLDSNRIGVYMGTGIGGANTFMDNHYHPILARQKDVLMNLAASEDLPDEARQELGLVISRMFHLRRINPFMVSMLMPNAVSANLGIHFSIYGPNKTYALACSSGTASVGAAYHAIRDGCVDVALTGGSEYLDDYYGYLFRAFDVAGVLVSDHKGPDSSNRPFDKDRTGFLFSQGGSVVMILEELEMAKERGAPVLAEIIGYGQSFDAYSMMSMDPTGTQIENMMYSCLRDAGISAADVDYVNAHGTGTQTNDEIECDILVRLFGSSTLVNSTKSLVGHTIGASGALETLVTALSLRDQTTHICNNLEKPIADLNFVRTRENFPMRVGFSESFAFGGHNAAVALQRYPD